MKGFLYDPLEKISGEISRSVFKETPLAIYEEIVGEIPEKIFLKICFLGNNSVVIPSGIW